MADDNDVEAQIERAVALYSQSRYSADKAIRDMLRAFAAGKFREEPLPEIARPPWPHSDPPATEKTVGYSWFVRCSSGREDWSGHIEGPVRSSKHEAILAWNAVFGARHER